MPRRPAAAIDLGSTSVHLLVARPDRTGLVVLHDESTFLGLGAAVDGPGSLGVSGRATLASTVGAYVDLARDIGATDPIVMGTEPLRRLEDATRIVAEVSSRTGVPLAVLEHEEEALLTLVGLTAGQAVRGDLLVVDIGGGSSELVEIGPERLARAAGVRLGAGRLTRSIVDRDPPTREQFDGARSGGRGGARLDTGPAAGRGRLRRWHRHEPAEAPPPRPRPGARRPAGPGRARRGAGRSSPPARPSCSRRPTGCGRPGSGCSPRVPRSSRPCSTGSTSPRAGSSTRGSARARSSPPTGRAPRGAIASKSSPTAGSPDGGPVAPAATAGR